METEFKIQKALQEVMKGRTTFIIAHRISSLKHADEILVLEDGEVEERGVHDRLVVNDGSYQRIYDICILCFLPGNVLGTYFAAGSNVQLIAYGHGSI